MMSGCSAVLLAAGSSRRLGFDKMLTPLAGRPGFLYAFEVLTRISEINEILVVTRNESREAMQPHLEETGSGIPWRFVEGGNERQDSVSNGIRQADPANGFILIHDAARPLICETLVRAVLEAAEQTGGAICGRPSVDTLKRRKDDGTIDQTLERSSIWQVETPQIFRADLIREAYEKVQMKGLSVTDDASAMEAAGHPVALVASDSLNLKITRAEDWHLLEMVLHYPKGLEARAHLHSVNNALSPLLGYLPFLRKYRKEEARFESYLQKIEEGSRRAVDSLKCCHELMRSCFPDRGQ